MMANCKLPTLDDVKKGLKSKTWISVYKPGGTLTDESNKTLLFTIFVVSWYTCCKAKKLRFFNFIFRNRFFDIFMNEINLRKK